MENFLKNLKEGNGIEYGEPWRLSDRSLGVAVPIISLIECVRNYRVLIDSDEYNVSDTGSISKLNLDLDTDEPVFIRSGSIFKGDTQSRSLQTSVVVMPGSNKQEIPVKCVHQTKGIRSGARLMHVRASTPHSVDKSLLVGSQSDVWNSIHTYTSHRHAPDRTPHSPQPNYVMPRAGSDDLVQELDNMKGDISEIIKKMPTIENQCGIIIFDADGVLGLEVFDSSDSWKEMREQIISKYGRELSKEADSIFEFNENKISSKVGEFIDKLISCEKQLSFEDKGARTFILKGSNVLGEFTELDNKIIHVLGMRNE